jgi:hypothetical protein
MPLFTSFSAISAKGLGMTSGFPPAAPVINTSSSTATTLTINFTSTPGSFTISKFEYSLNGAAYTGNILGNAVTYQFTGLIPSTSYTVAIRAVDESAQTSPNSNTITRSTTAEIAPSAPTVTVTQKESTGTPINATKLDVSFGAASAGTYAVAYYQYQVYRGATLVTDWTTTPVGTGTTFTLQSLTPSSSHTVYVRGVATGNGTTFGSSGSGTATTDTEIAPSAPSVSLAQRESGNGAPSDATKLNWSYGVATAGTYPVTSYQYTLYQGATLVSDWAAVPMAPNTNYIFTGLTPSRSYTVYVRGVATANGTTYGSNGSATAFTDTEILNSAPSVTINYVNTANVTFTRGNSSGGTYGVSYYDWVVANSAGGWVNYGTTTNTSLTVSAGLPPDQTFTVYVRARSLTSNNPGVWGSAGGQLNPGVPSAPTIAFSGMSANSSVDVSLTVSKETYATSAYVEVIGVGTYQATDQGSYFSLSLGGQPFNSTIQYRAYVRNRLGAIGQSGYGNTVTWYTPKQNQYYHVTGRAGEWQLAATNSILEPACPSPYASVTWGYVPPSPNDVGYVRIDYVGVQLKTGGFSNTVTDYLFFSTPTGNVSSSLVANTDASYSLRFDSINVGGSSLSGGTIALNFLWVDGNPAGSAARISSWCVPNGNNWFWAKEFYVQGVQTTAGSFG